ncbi:MAG: MFS transporter [Thermoleophilia bacterium]|nr:MFS transporter [Thermoleophilia bacterium]
MFGTQVSQLALPLVAIIVLEATAFQVALVGTVAMLPFILFSLPAGVWVDRLPRRPILVAGDLGRALLLLSIPAAHWLDVLTLEQLYVVGFLSGICTVFFDVAYQSYLPSLVDRSQLVEGNSKLEVSRSGAQIGGPGIAGALVELLTAPIAILVDAISYVVSGLFVLAIRTREAVPERPKRRSPFAGMRAELAEGLRYVLGHRLLRPIAMCTAISNFFYALVFAILLVYVVRTLGLSPATIGVVLSVGNVGFLAGALLANRVAVRVGVGRTIVLGSMLFGPSLLLIPAAPPALPHPFLAASIVLAGFGAVVYNITQVSLRQAITPHRLQGRMNSVMRFVVWGVIPLGSLLGGALGTWIGLRPAMWVGGAGAALAFLPVVLSPVRSIGEMPEPVEPPVPQESVPEAPLTAPATVQDD